MSGIFGVMCNADGMKSTERDLHKLKKWNHAYGTDDEQICQGEYYALGCCYEEISPRICKSLIMKQRQYLSVIDALVYNPEILGSSESERSDEELIMDQICDKGYNTLAQINGDFSGAVLDEKKQTLTLFRDHLGVRTLYYYADDRMTAFSTDIRGLLALEGVDATINEEWIYRTCTGYYMDGVEATEYKHIFCVKPSSYITFSYNGNKLSIKQDRYWDIGLHKKHLNSFEEYKKELKELVTDSVRRRLLATQHKIGAELSGGLDSGVIDIIINRLGRQCEFYSWSVDPKEVSYAEADERLIIEDICRQENIECHYSNLHSDWGKEANIYRYMQNLGFELQDDEPLALKFVLPPYINAMTISETAGYMRQNGVKLIFTGHGGDEGVSHRCNLYELFYHHEYLDFIKNLWGQTRGEKYRFYHTMKNGYRILVKNRKYLRKPFRGPFAAPEFINKDFADKFREEDMPAMHFAYDPIKYIKEGGSRNRLDNIALLGAYNGVRYVVPFLDYRVVDYAVSIPRHLYVKNGKNRYIFREAFKDIMPDSLYSLMGKEDNSKKNYPTKEDWYTEYAQIKQQVYKKLDRDYWSRYLNYDEIDKWMEKGKPSDKERRQDMNKLMNLHYCAMAQNLIEKARKVRC